jgi:hypothetical protein
MRRFVVPGLVVLLCSAALAADKPGTPNREIPDLVAQPDNWVTISIPLKYVKPSIMANWLDPEKHPALENPCLTPRTGTSNPAIQVPAKFPKGSNALEMPKGVDTLAPLDDQNILQVRGTPVALQEMKHLLALIDTPRKQVELEVALYWCDAETIKQLQATEPNAPGGNATLFFIARKNTFLETALADGRLQLQKKETLHTYNNLATCSESHFTGPDTAQNTTSKMTLAPTVNGDGTLTVLVETKLQQFKAVEGQAAPAMTSESMQTVFIGRDGDTIALGSTGPKTIGQNWLYLVTARTLKDRIVAAPEK